MIQHLKEICEAFVVALDGRGGFEPIDVGRTLVKGLEGLDIRDFAADARSEFLMTLEALTRWTEAPRIAEPETSTMKKRTTRMVELLDRYGAFAVSAPREFMWLSDPELKKIIERDYAELHGILMPSSATKSAVIMAGSLAEAILMDVLTKHPDRNAKAKATKVAQGAKDDTGKPIAETRWKLFHLIAIATEMDLISAERSKTFDVMLRDYRNFVHPLKEMRAKHACGEPEANMAKGALDALCDHFDKTLKT